MEKIQKFLKSISDRASPLTLHPSIVDRWGAGWRVTTGPQFRSSPRPSPHHCGRSLTHLLRLAPFDLLPSSWLSQAPMSFLLARVLNMDNQIKYKNFTKVLSQFYYALIMHVFMRSGKILLKFFDAVKGWNMTQFQIALARSIIATIKIN